MFDLFKYLSTPLWLYICLISSMTVYCKLCSDIYEEKALASLDDSCTCNQSSNKVALIVCSEWSSQQFLFAVSNGEMIVNGLNTTIPFKFTEWFVPLINKSNWSSNFYPLKVTNFCNDSFLTSHHLNLSNLLNNDNNDTGILKMPYNCLQSITISKNDIRTFYELDFSFNKLTQIPKHFHEMFFMSFYDLSYNNINTVSKTDFDILPHVMYLNLSDNNLRSLPQDTLNDLFLLNELNLSHNFISDLPENIFDKNIFLQKLDVSYNKLTKLSKFIFSKSIFLEEINLSHNKIIFIDLKFDSTNSLKVLRLESNDIVEFRLDNVYNDCIYLNNNNSLIGDDLISNKLINELNCTPIKFHNLSEVILSHNKITHVNLTQFQTLWDKHKNIYFDLSYNPFVCDCRLNKFIKYLNYQTKPFRFENIENHFCSSPPKLNGTSLANIQNNLLCDYAENCPVSCHCYIDDIENILWVLIDCTNSKLTHFPNITSYGLSVAIHLNLSHNQISSLPSKSDPIWTKITILDLSHNRIDTLKNMTLRPILTTLYLTYNSLSEFDHHIASLSQVTHLKLANNPWKCNCEMSKLLVELSGIEDKYEMSCVNVEDKTIYNFTNVDEICISLIGFNWLLLFLPIIVIVIVIFVIVILFIKYKSEIVYYMFSKGICLKFVSDDDIDADKVYDAFVSYSNEDENWIRDFLVPGLETGNPTYNLCLHNRDWLAGEFITDQIVKSVKSSRRTIIVLTDNFLNSPWSRLEFDVAYQQGLKDQVRRLLIVIPNEVPDLSQIDPNFKTFITLTTYIQANKPHFWSKLRASMPRTKPKSKSSTTRRSVYLNSDVSHEENIEMVKQT